MTVGRSRSADEVPDVGASRAGDPAAPGAHRARMSVRSRVLSAVIVVSLLGMVVTGGIAFVVQERLVDASITNSLEQEVAEFRTLATQGIDPETGAPFASIERLLKVTLQRNVPDRNETYLTVVDGRPLEFDGGERPIQLEEEPAVLAAAADATPASGVVIRDVPTSAGPARLAIIPVGVEGEDATGALVLAYAVDLERADLIRLARTYLLVSAGSLVLVAVVGWLVAGRLLRPLRTLREATQRISETDLTERIPEKGNDDITDLTRTYNSMLDRLQEALDTQRRFLDDAGHELRTPLTIVRGHLELLDSADPAEVEQTRALLIDEVDRMGRMVEDLILLSKARRPDFLIVDLVDLGSFTDDVLGKIRTLGDRHWVQAARADGHFVGDAQRLTQALVELAHNAVKFSAAGSVVSLGSEATADEVRLWIKDDGVGIESDDLGQVFDRFGRASSGRGVEGSGLGLSIVAAIAAAHGGHVEVWTAVGAGSTFVLVLPVGFDDPAEPAEDQQMELLQLFHADEEESAPSTRPIRTPS
jgi:signal transduction histidine kinase